MKYFFGPSRQATAFDPAWKAFESNIMNIFSITVIWAVMVILVNPIGDFPLNDDWAYGWSVKTLVEKRELSAFRLDGYKPIISGYLGSAILFAFWVLIHSTSALNFNIGANRRYCHLWITKGG